MSVQDCLKDLANRQARFQQRLKSGRVTKDDSAMLAEDWAFLYGPGTVGIGRSGAVIKDDPVPPEIVKLLDPTDTILFTTTLLQEDRDGDVVIPLGGRFKNYAKNPVWFFGHQEWEVSIGQARSADRETLYVWPTQDRVRVACRFDMDDPDAAYIKGKVDRGFLNATSMAFVPIVAMRRDEVEKANPHRDRQGTPRGWIFEEWDATENSVVGVPSNAGAIRDSLDAEKGWISPRLQKGLRVYAAKSVNESGGCWTGWCPRPMRAKTMTAKVEKAPQDKWFAVFYEGGMSSKVYTGTVQRRSSMEAASYGGQKYGKKFRGVAGPFDTMAQAAAAQPTSASDPRPVKSAKKSCGCPDCKAQKPCPCAKVQKAAVKVGDRVVIARTHGGFAAGKSGVVDQLATTAGDKGAWVKLDEGGGKEWVALPNLLLKSIQADIDNGFRPPENEQKATNYLGEQEFRNYNAWVRAVKAKDPSARIEGDRDIANALSRDGKGIGEWDGEVGVLYNKSLRKAQPSDDISPDKACKILQDGSIDGQPLTDDQRGMFGAACARASKSYGGLRETCKALMGKQLQEASGSAGGYAVGTGDNWGDPQAGKGGDQTRDVQTDRYDLCTLCGGDGNCLYCGGDGSIDGIECAECDGSGQCSQCDGTGEAGKRQIGEKQVRQVRKGSPPDASVRVIAQQILRSGGSEDDAYDEVGEHWTIQDKSDQMRVERIISQVFGGRKSLHGQVRKDWPLWFQAASAALGTLGWTVVGYNAAKVVSYLKDLFKRGKKPQEAAQEVDNKMPEQKGQPSTVRKGPFSWLFGKRPKVGDRIVLTASALGTQGYQTGDTGKVMAVSEDGDITVHMDKGGTVTLWEGYKVKGRPITVTKGSQRQQDVSAAALPRREQTARAAMAGAEKIRDSYTYNGASIQCGLAADAAANAGDKQKETYWRGLEQKYRALAGKSDTMTITKFLVKTAKGYVHKDDDGTYTDDPDEAKDFDDQDDAQAKADEEGDSEVVEMDFEDPDAVDKDSADEPFMPKPSAKVLAKLYKHLKAADDWIDSQMKEIDHPGVAEGLQKFKDEVLPEGMNTLKAMLHEHHKGDEDIDADGLMDKMCKALETDDPTAGAEANPGEAGMVSDGEIPPDSEMAGGMGPDPQDQGAAPFNKDDDSSTEDVLERYQEPATKRWKVRVVGKARRSTSGRLYIVPKSTVTKQIKVGDTVVFKGPYGTESGKVTKMAGDQVTIRTAAGQSHTVSSSQVMVQKAASVKVGERALIYRGDHSGRHGKVVAVDKYGVTVQVDNGTNVQVPPEAVGPEKSAKSVRKGDGAIIMGSGDVNWNDTNNDFVDYKAILPDEDVDAVKDAADFMDEMSGDDAVPKSYRVVGKQHGRRLGTIHKALTDQGKYQRDGGSGGALTDQGKYQRDGGSGGALSNQGAYQGKPAGGKGGSVDDNKDKNDFVKETDPANTVEKDTPLSPGAVAAVRAIARMGRFNGLLG